MSRTRVSRRGMNIEVARRVERVVTGEGGGR